MSKGWREGPYHVPTELHHRPGYFVNYMQEVQLKAADITTSMVRVIDATAGKYSVQSSSGPRVYAVDFGHETGRPSCTCYEFARHHLPCKHFAAVFMHRQLSFSSLPTSYTQHPMLTADPAYMAGRGTGSMQQHESLVTPPPQQPTDDVQQLAPDDETELGRTARWFREVLSDINNLTYLSTSTAVLHEAGNLLVDIQRIVERSCPADVLHVLPSVTKKRPVPRRQFTSPELPPRKRCRTKGRQTSSVGDEDEETGSAPANTATTAETTNEQASTPSVLADAANEAQQTGVSSTVNEGAQSAAAGKRKKKAVRFSADTKKIPDFFRPSPCPEPAVPDKLSVSVSQLSSFANLLGIPLITRKATVKNVDSCFGTRSSSHVSVSGYKISLSKSDLMSVTTGQCLCDNVSTTCNHLWLCLLD